MNSFNRLTQLKIKELSSKVYEILNYNLNEKNIIVYHYIQKLFNTETQHEESGLRLMSIRIATNILKSLHENYGITVSSDMNFNNMEREVDFKKLPEINETQHFSLTALKSINTMTDFLLFIYNKILKEMNAEYTSLENFNSKKKTLKEKIQELIKNNLKYNESDKYFFEGHLKTMPERLEIDIENFSEMIADIILRELATENNIRFENPFLDFDKMDEKFDFEKLESLNNSIRHSLRGKKIIQYTKEEFILLIYNRIHFYYKVELEKRKHEFLNLNKRTLRLFDSSKSLQTMTENVSYLKNIMYVLNYLTPFKSFLITQLQKIPDSEENQLLIQIKSVFFNLTFGMNEPSIEALSNTVKKICKLEEFKGESDIVVAEACIIKYLIALFEKSKTLSTFFNIRENLPSITQVPRNLTVLEFFQTLTIKHDEDYFKKYRIIHFVDIYAAVRMRNNFRMSHLERNVSPSVHYQLYAIYVDYIKRNNYGVFIRGKWIPTAYNIYENGKAVAQSSTYWRSFDELTSPFAFSGKREKMVPMQVTYQDFKEDDEFFYRMNNQKVTKDKEGKLNITEADQSDKVVITGYIYVEESLYNSFEWK